MFGRASSSIKQTILIGVIVIIVVAAFSSYKHLTPDTETNSRKNYQPLLVASLSQGRVYFSWDLVCYPTRQSIRYVRMFSHSLAENPPIQEQYLLPISAFFGNYKYQVRTHVGLEFAWITGSCPDITTKEINYDVNRFRLDEAISFPSSKDIDVGEKCLLTNLNQYKSETYATFEEADRHLSVRRDYVPHLSNVIPGGELLSRICYGNKCLIGYDIIPQSFERYYFVVGFKDKLRVWEVKFKLIKSLKQHLDFEYDSIISLIGEYATDLTDDFWAFSVNDQLFIVTVKGELFSADLTGSASMESRLVCSKLAEPIVVVLEDSDKKRVFAFSKSERIELGKELKSTRCSLANPNAEDLDATMSSLLACAKDIVD